MKFERAGPDIQETFQASCLPTEWRSDRSEPVKLRRGLDIKLQKITVIDSNDTIQIEEESKITQIYFVPKNVLEAEGS